MWEDPIVAEVRRVREELAAKFNFDVDAILADTRTRQAALGKRLVSQRESAQLAAERTSQEEAVSGSQNEGASG
jgi:hypothetical protein